MRSGLEGAPVLNFSADFSGGGAYCAAGTTVTGANLVGINALKLRVLSPNVQKISVRVVDGTGQTHQIKDVPIEADNRWHDVILRTAQTERVEHWGGANDGKWHDTMSEVYFLLSKDSDPTGQRPVLNLSDVRVEGVVPTPSTILPATVTPKSVPPGRAVKITYHWKAMQATTDYGVFVHITDSTGAMVFQDDHSLFPLTTSKWSGPVNYTRNLIVPANLPDGQYKIIAGLAKLLPSGWFNVPLNPARGVTAQPGNSYLIGTITVDHRAPNPRLDSVGPKTLNLKGYKLTFDDEFDSLNISPRGPGTRWIAHLPYNGDFGDAAFVDPSPGFPFSTSNGVLKIQAKKVNGRWQTGLMSTVDDKGNGFKQKYGYFEMRAKFPKGPGTWPAFWLNTPPNALNPEMANMELDIVEQYGINPQALHSTMHWWRHPGHDGIGTMAMVQDMTNDFHRYGLLWNEKNVIWYFDSVEVYRLATPPELRERSLYVLVNLALGSGWPIDKTPDPSDMLVDYVRVYAKK